MNLNNFTGTEDAFGIKISYALETHKAMCVCEAC